MQASPYCIAKKRRGLDSRGCILDLQLPAYDMTADWFKIGPGSLRLGGMVIARGTMLQREGWVYL